MNTTVKDVMTTRVIWVKKDATFREMAAALREHRVSAFPVVDDDRKVIGVVSEADMLTKEALIDEPGVISGILHHRDQVKARGVTAGDLMTTAVVAVRPDDTVEHAAKLMYDRAGQAAPGDRRERAPGRHHQPGRRALGLRPDGRGHRPRDHPRRAPRRVHGGPAGLPGDRDGRHRDPGRPPETNETGHEIVRRVRHVPGVVAVRDRLNYPPPERLGGRYDVVANFPMD